MRKGDNHNWNVSTRVELNVLNGIASFHRKYNSLPPPSGYLLKVTFLQYSESFFS